MHLATMLAFLLIPAALLWFLGWERAADWWSRLVGIAILFIIWLQFKADNSQTEIVKPAHRAVTLTAFKFWLPIFAMLFPAIIATCTIDSFVTNATNLMEARSTETLVGISDAGAEAVNNKTQQLSSKTYRWWWPPDYVQEYFDQKKIDLLKKAEEGLAVTTEGGSFLLQLFWACIYLVLNLFHTISWALICFLLARSFLWIWLRTWLRLKGEVNFKLAAHNA